MNAGNELTEAKEKLAKAEDSSSDTDDEAPKRRRVESGDRPTEEMIEKMEEKLEAANVDQKRLFLIIFQRFIMILSEHLVRCDTDGRDYNTDWYRWTIGRLQQVFLFVSFIHNSTRISKRYKYLTYSMIFNEIIFLFAAS